MPSDEKTLSVLVSLLVKDKPVNMGARLEKIYCMTKDEQNNLRIPFYLLKSLWGLTGPDYTSFPRMKIDCKIQLGIAGKEYQIPTYNAVVQNLIANKCAFLSLQCGGGKTMLATKAFSEMGLKGAVLTDVKLIFPQWVNVMQKETNARIVEIKKGRDKNKIPLTKLPEGDIYVMMYKAARHLHPSVLADIKFLIVDEATYFMTPDKIPTILNFTPAYTLGLCAEIERNDGMHVFLPYFFGPNVVRRISDVPFTVYRVDTNYVPTVKYQRYTGKPDWNAVLESLANNQERNEDIIHLCRSLPESKIIVGTKRKDQAKYIYKRLTDLGEKTGLLIEKANTIPQCRILVGIYSKMGRGVDTKNLCPDWDGDVFDVAILALDACNPEQFVGRVFRHDIPVVYDFVDNYSTLRKHFDEDRCPWYISRNGKIVRMIINRNQGNNANQGNNGLAPNLNLIEQYGAQGGQGREMITVSDRLVKKSHF